MAKFGIGVGEEFPVDDAAARNPPPPKSPDAERECRYDRRGHRMMHLFVWLAFTALIAVFLAWMFVPHGHMHGFAGPYAFYPYHHHFFFPFFPVLLIVLLLGFAFRHRHGCYGSHRWHGGSRDRGEGV
jgi:hypothetical protein